MPIDDSNICLICLEDLIDGQVSKDFTIYVHKICECRYKVHKTCIARWVDYKSTCLLCNRKIIYKEPFFARIKRNLCSIRCSRRTSLCLIICIQRIFCYMWVLFIVRIIILYGETRGQYSNMPSYRHIDPIEDNQGEVLENTTIKL